MGPPAYSKVEDCLPQEQTVSSDQDDSRPRTSLSTNGEGESGPSHWCKLAYWELSSRVGRQFCVGTPSVDVFWNLPQGEGLCLSALAHHRLPPPPAAVHRARQKIGRGVTLSKEEDGVWAYNRSEVPVFVNSAWLAGSVARVPPGHCLVVYREGGWRPPPRLGPLDPRSVRLSFVKGWGPRYSRQDVTACPTWIEVLLSPAR